MIESWRPVSGFENFLVSDQGRVMNHKTGYILKPFVRGRGNYLAVTMYDKNKKQPRSMNIHRLVAEAFLGPKPEGLQTMHLNDDKSDNRVENLAYGTQSENMLMLVANGKHRHRTSPPKQSLG